MNWFLVALIAPALWALSNYLDKYLIGKYFKDRSTGTLLIFSSVIGFLVLPFILFIEPSVLGVSYFQATFLILNGFIYVFGFLPYLVALKRDETSIVVPLFQTIPVFTFILGYFFLGEVLSLQQIIACLLIIFGAVVISLEISDIKNPKLKSDIFFLMLLSSFLVALNGFLFKFFAIETSFLKASFWEYIGFAILAILFLTFVKNYRKDFLLVFKANKASVLTINGFNEVINIIAKIAMNFATLLAPLTLAWVVNGFQPFFLLLYGVLLTLFLPKLAEENITKKHLTHKILAISVMFIGVIVLNYKF